MIRAKSDFGQNFLRNSIFQKISKNFDFGQILEKNSIFFIDFRKI